MVCKVEEFRLRRQESMKRGHDNEVKGKEARQEVVKLPCNKKKACKFKRSCFSEEEDAASFALLLLACIVCAPCKEREKLRGDREMDCSFSGGLSWADQWDYNTPDPLPLSSEDGKKKKKKKGDGKDGSSKLKKLKSIGTFVWIKELCQKKSNK